MHARLIGPEAVEEFDMGDGDDMLMLIICTRENRERPDRGSMKLLQYRDAGGAILNRDIRVMPQRSHEIQEQGWVEPRGNLMHCALAQYGGVHPGNPTS